MKRLLVCAIAGILAVGTAGVIIADAQQRERSAFIPGDPPVGEQQVRTQLQTDGWSGVKIVANGRYFDVTGTRAGAAAKVKVDSQTGRISAADDDDDDDDY